MAQSFDISQLRCFVALAEELHFGHAAARLNMTQAPFTRHIQRLERLVGAKLVDRNSRYVRLTAAGKAFLADARAILRECDEAALNARRVAKGEGGVITLGFIPATSYSLLPRLVAFMRTEMPQVQLALKEMVTSIQVEALEKGAIDAGILRMPIDLKDAQTFPISRDPFLLATPADHPLASLRKIRPRQLDGVPFVMYAPEESRYHHDLVSTLFRAADVRPEFVQFAREIHTMLALVGAGLGVALVPAMATNLVVAGVAMKPIELPAGFASELTSVWRKNSSNPALRVFVRELLPSFLRQR